MIEVDVEFSRGDFSLQVQFESGAGLTGLFGPSGSGKTTLIHLIAGLLQPTRGRIAIGGETLFNSTRNIELPARLRRVGLVYQDALLFPHLNVRQNLLFGHFFTPHAERRIPYESVVDTLGIGALVYRRPGTLSGGERQRVALARALLASPRILLMDEPLASLDFERKLEIISLIERLRDEYRIPIVYVSHAIEEVGRLAGYVVVMRAGRVVGVGPPSEALAQVNRAAAADRFGIVSLVGCEVAEFDPSFEVTNSATPCRANHCQRSRRTEGQGGPGGDPRDRRRPRNDATVGYQHSHGVVRARGRDSSRERSSVACRDRTRRQRPAHGVAHPLGCQRARTRSRSPRLRIDQGGGDRPKALPSS